MINDELICGQKSAYDLLKHTNFERGMADKSEMSSFSLKAFTNYSKKALLLAQSVMK